MNPNIKAVLKKIQDGIPRTIWFDIDGTIADTSGNDYEKSEPDENIIKLVNMLHDQGHVIFIITARGASSGINWKDITEYQLRKWGVKYDKLIMGYPRDLFIDDATLRPDEFVRMI
jgi:trehalose-6-phosphatase